MVIIACFYMGTVELLAGRAWPSASELGIIIDAAPRFTFPIVMTTPASHSSDWNLLRQDDDGDGNTGNRSVHAGSSNGFGLFN